MSLHALQNGLFGQLKAKRVQRGKTRRKPTASPLRIELLEDRTLLANAANTFATFDGILASPTSTAEIPIALTSADFTLSHKRVELGFRVQAAAGSTLNPAAVK